jgi:hypothetical protein
LRVKKREVTSRESARDDRAEKAGTATDFEHAIGRQKPQTINNPAGWHYQIAERIEKPTRIFDRIHPSAGHHRRLRVA